MSFGDCTNPDTGESMSIPLINQSGGNELDITKWGAKRINLTIADVQKTIQEGISAAGSRGITPFNISGATDRGGLI